MPTTPQLPPLATADQRDAIKETIAGLSFICQISDTGQLVDAVFSELDKLAAARDRQIVELCASAVMELTPRNDPSDWTEYAKTRAEAFAEAAARLRALLGDKGEK